MSFLLNWVKSSRTQPRKYADQGDERGLLSSQRDSQVNCPSAREPSIGGSGIGSQEPRSTFVQSTDHGQQSLLSDLSSQHGIGPPDASTATGPAAQLAVPEEVTPVTAHHHTDDRIFNVQLTDVGADYEESINIYATAITVPLPASPPPASLSLVQKRLKEWERARRSALETAKSTVIALERRRHARNLRSRYLDAAQSFYARIAKSEVVANLSNEELPTLLDLRTLLESAEAAEVEIELSDNLLAEKEYELSRLTTDTFEDEESAEKLFDMLHAEGVDIMAPDDLSITSVYSDDAIDLVTLDDTAGQVARKTDQINILEDLFTRIHSELESNTNIDCERPNTAELQERQHAVEKEISIAYAEREQLRATSEALVDLDVILGLPSSI
jgi:hypothetical protein